jgi:predicted Zn-dependent peptidase
MVVVGAGAVSHRQFVAEAEACFAGLSGLTVAKPAMGRFTPGVAADERPIEQVHFALALAGRAKIDPQRRNLQIFGHILGGDMSSRLFHEAREKRGLCYSIEAAHSEWSDSGLFVIYAQTDPDRIASLIGVIEEESLAAVRNITEAEVARAKAQFKSGMLMAMETSSARAGSLAEDILVRGRPMTLQEFAADIDAVTVAGVRAAGRSVLADTRPAIAVLGPRPGLDKLAHLADLFADLHKATPRPPATPRAARPEAVAELSG